MITEIVKNYTCPVCLKQFKSESYRYNHCKDFHNGVGLKYIEVLENIYESEVN